MSTGVLYTAVVTAKGGREGHVRSSDGVWSWRSPCRPNLVGREALKLIPNNFSRLDMRLALKVR